MSAPKTLSQLERETLALWQQEHLAEAMLAAGEKDFSFFDGPPFATGMPHFGHLLAGSVKDAMCRFAAMNGHRVPRTWGWDCHGVPVEHEVEKSRNEPAREMAARDGVAAFCAACRVVVMRCVDSWRDIIPRSGRVVDFENAYRTMDAPYMRAMLGVWRSVADRGLISRGNKVLSYSPLLQCALSNFEANLEYHEVNDPTVTVALRLRDEPNTHLLAWTTTPWTLPANLALGINPALQYARVRRGDAEYIVAKSRVAAVFGLAEEEAESAHQPQPIGPEQLPQVRKFFEEHAYGEGVAIGFAAHARQQLTAAFSGFVVWDAEDEIIAAVRVLPPDAYEPEFPRIGSIAVHPAHQKQGLGAALVRAAARWAVQAGHGFLLANSREEAEPFYKKLGFAHADNRPSLVEQDMKMAPMLLPLTSVIKTFPGSELVGKQYQPLFPYVADADNAFQLLAADFATDTDGTGVVHLAPAFGEDDLNTCAQNGIAAVDPLTPDGRYPQDFQEKSLRGLYFRADEKVPDSRDNNANRAVLALLRKSGAAFAEGSLRHAYPHCWRTGAALMYRACPSFFVDTPAIRPELLQANEDIHWVPAHLKKGRFGKMLENAPQWSVSRSRFWGAPVPVWECEDCQHQVHIGSVQNLYQLAPSSAPRIVFVRHGQSDHNVGNYFHSHDADGESLLTKQGIEEIEQAAAQQKAIGRRFTRIIASPLARAQQSAKILKEKLGIEADIQTDERLAEIHMGELHAKPISSRTWRSETPEQSFAESLAEGAESKYSVCRRTEDFLREMRNEYGGENILVVTHGDVLRAASRYFYGLSAAEMFGTGSMPKTGAALEFCFATRPENEGKQIDLHRPFIDQVVLGCPSCAGKMQRVPEVLDCWFESGAMPYASRGVHLAKNRFVRRSQQVLQVQSLPADAFLRRIEKGETALDTASVDNLKKNAPRPEVTCFGVLLPNGTLVGRLLAESQKNGTQANFFGLYVEEDFRGQGLARELVEVAEEHLRERAPGRQLEVCIGAYTSKPYLKEKYASWGYVSTGQTQTCNVENADFLVMHKRVAGWMPAPKASDASEKNMPTAAPFQADFIAEGLDQTRGWFFTLHVLAVALFARPAFKNVIANGIVLAADGQKMSKSKKNFPELAESFERLGADPMRLFLLGSPAARGEEVCLSEAGVAEAERAVLAPLRNALAFLQTYAEVDNLDIHQLEIPDLLEKTDEPLEALDSWMLAETGRAVSGVRGAMEAYDIAEAVRHFAPFADLLTNGYIRWNRRRFWASGMPTGKRQAFATLAHALRTFALLLAPICPFFADYLWRRVRHADQPASVHLVTRFPSGADFADSPEIRTDISTARRIISLALRLRAQSSIRVRQPLACLRVAAAQTLSPLAIQLIKEEANVHQIHSANATDIATQTLRPDARKLGPRLGQQMKDILAAARAGEANLLPDGRAEVAGEVLEADEFEQIFQGKDGQQAAGEAGVVVALDTNLTPELLAEGQARDIIRRAQQMRKDAGLRLTDRITLAIVGAPDALAAHHSDIAQEVLATSISKAPLKKPIAQEDMGGIQLAIALAE